MRRVSLILGLAGVCWQGLTADTNRVPEFDAPIRRVIVYKDGHCFTQREATLILRNDRAYTSSIPYALFGSVWAYSRNPQVPLIQLTGQVVYRDEEVKPDNLRELLILNANQRVEVELHPLPFYMGGERAPRVSSEVVRGVLRVARSALPPSDSYQPPPWAPAPTDAGRPSSPWTGGYFGRMPEPGAEFWIESAEGIVPFSVTQVKRVRFLDTPKRARTEKVATARWELLFGGDTKSGQSVTVVLCAVERGLIWLPEYRLHLPSPDATTATLSLNATLLNELSDLKDAAVYVAIGLPQFLTGDTLSPLSLRADFLRLSQWFGEDAGAARGLVGQFGGFGGFGGVVPAAPATSGPGGMGGALPFGMGLETLMGSEMVQPDQPETMAGMLPDPVAGTTAPLALLPLPRLSLARNAAVYLTLREQQVPVRRVYFWQADLTGADTDDTSAPPPSSFGFDSRRQPPPPSARAFRTYEELREYINRTRRLRGEVQDVLIVSNTGNIPWTTAPILLLQGETPVAQDVLLYTPAGADAMVYLGVTRRVTISHTYSTEGRWERGVEQKFVRGQLRVVNLNPEPAPLMVHLRIQGEFVTAAIPPTQILAAGRAPTRFGWWWDWWEWHKRRGATLLIWELTVPPGETVWDYRYRLP